MPMENDKAKNNQNQNFKQSQVISKLVISISYVDAL